MFVTNVLSDPIDQKTCLLGQDAHELLKAANNGHFPPSNVRFQRLRDPPPTLALLR